MKHTRLLMGMPITIEIVDETATVKDIEDIFSYFVLIDERFSTYKPESEISKINRREIQEKEYSQDMREIFLLSEQTKNETDGYFTIVHNGQIDPSGIVKGWSIFRASQILQQKGFANFYIDAGGDVQVSGKNAKGQMWKVGIRNPFDSTTIVKTLRLSEKGIATSGTYERGKHIYNPHQKDEVQNIVSITVIGPNVYEADRFATAAFAMGDKGIYFIEKLSGFEGYMIDKDGNATMTGGFKQYVSE